MYYNHVLSYTLRFLTTVKAAYVHINYTPIDTNMVNLTVNFSQIHGNMNTRFITMTTRMHSNSVNKNNLLSW